MGCQRQPVPTAHADGQLIVGVHIPRDSCHPVVQHILEGLVVAPVDTLHGHTEEPVEIQPQGAHPLEKPLLALEHRDVALRIIISITLLSQHPHDAQGGIVSSW